jgi:hypothetical protein
MNTLIRHVRAQFNRANIGIEGRCVQHHAKQETGGAT